MASADRPDWWEPFDDPYDPAIWHIQRACGELLEFGFDLRDPDVLARAIATGRERYEDWLRRAADLHERQLATTSPADTPGEVVYYMRLGDRVKIGWTTNVRSRMRTIRPEELLAVEVGGLRTEQHRHRQFARLRASGEWFRYEGELIEHVRALQTSKAAS